MKKILTVSLFAMMAVSAANADIASTAYVEGQTGTLNDLTTTAKGNLVAAINEVDANIGTVSFAAEGYAKDASDLTEAINVIDAALKSTSNNLTGDITSRIGELETDVSAMDTAYKAADTELDNRLSSAEDEIEGLQSDKANKATTLAGYGITDAYTKTYMDGELGKKQNNLNQTQMDAVNSTITSAKVTKYDGYSALITTAQQQADKGVADAATAQAAAEAAQAAAEAAQADADANGTEITAIKDEKTGILALAKADAKAKADKALEDAKAYTDGEINTLEESLGTTAGNLTNLTTRVTTAEGNITSLQSNKADKATTLAGYGITDAYTKTYMDGELGNKQNNLNQTQMDAVNSTITSAKVTKYDGYSTLITAAQGSADAAKSAADKAQETADGAVTVNGQQGTAISANTAAITKLNGDKDVDGSVDKKIYTTVGELEGNKTVVGMINDRQKKSTAMSLAAADGAWIDLTNDATTGWVTSKCNQNGVTCSLVSKNGSIKWEKVTY